VNEILSPTAFKWFLTLVTGIVAGTWVLYDLFNLYRIRTADKRDPLVRDKVFGYFCGIAVGVIGVLGCLRFHDVM
jgi:hypothetical protein